uniref:Uncharacterized protein n=1 Tax=Entomoneis paludosa TaxID=265537 RepID=A0A7S2V7J9_9STRA|mmetsp:Transcript_10305/g.21203  ORF Transcript_10305/g.21203 Transcript_10305/m.21203 type:complete len:162 (+) Transcript_10305:31-516(+)
MWCAATSLTQQVVPCTPEDWAQMDHTTIPPHLQDYVQTHPEQVYFSYLDTHFSVHQNDTTTQAAAPDHNVQGILRMQGHTVPSPEVPNRWETWFIGGSCTAQPGQDMEPWDQVFGGTSSSLEYQLPQAFPAYNDVLYLDETLRISVGNFGTRIINQRPIVQ